MAARIIIGRCLQAPRLMSGHFELLLFASDPGFVRRATAGGIDGIIVDWENLGKYSRQSGADTQINSDTVDDLRRVRGATDANVICRINGFGKTTTGEVEQVLSIGADEILMPMVRCTGEVEAVLEQVAGRCQVGILIETVEAVQQASELSKLPISRAYVGLNDLAIQRRSPSIFTALADSLVEQLRQAVTVPFGFGGLTLPDRGEPIPCRLLIGEMARLGCQFSFLRRSFYRDIVGRRLPVEIHRIRRAIEQAAAREADVVLRDRQELLMAIRKWPQKSELYRNGNPC